MKNTFLYESLFDTFPVVPCSDDDAAVTLEHVLIFFSGASKVPPLGWLTVPELHFNSTNIYPTASICALHLVLPTKHHRSFKCFMEQGLADHGDFGKI